MLRRARAGQGHERRRRAGVDELPVVPDVHGAHVRSATTSTSRSRSCAPTTTGTSTSGAAPIPGRFIPMAVPAIWDVEQTAAEVRRCAAKGCHSLSFTENPAALGYPSFHDDYWDPLWQACCDTGTVLSIHLGSSGRLSIPAVDSPPDVMITLQPMNIQSAAADLLWSRVLKKFPDLRVALSEGGTGWIPYFLDRRRPHVRDAPRVDAAGLRRPTSERGVPRALPHVLHQRSGRRRDARAHRHRQHGVGGRLPAQRLDVAERAGGARRRVQRQRGARRAHPQDDPRERDALVLVRSLHARAEGGGDRGRAAPARPAGHDVSIMSRSTRMRTPDEKLEGFRSRARRAIAAGAS